MNQDIQPDLFDWLPEHTEQEVEYVPAEEILSSVLDPATSPAVLPLLAEQARLLPFEEAQQVLTAIIHTAWQRGMPLDFIHEANIATASETVLSYEIIMRPTDYPGYAPEEPESESEDLSSLERVEAAKDAPEGLSEAQEVSFEGWIGIDVKQSEFLARGEFSQGRLESTPHKKEKKA